MNRNTILYLLEIDWFYLINLVSICTSLLPHIMSVAKMEMVYTYRTVLHIGNIHCVENASSDLSRYYGMQQLMFFSLSSKVPVGYSTFKKPED